MPLPLYVVSATAPAGEQDLADYLCDGTADQVEIQAAIDAARAAGGGTVRLSQGEFNTTATITLNGTDDQNDEHEVYLIGAGPGNTRLIPTARGFTGTAVLSLGHCVRAHVWDIDFLVNGALDGISSTRSTGQRGDNRAFWMSSFERLSFSGPGNGTHTGWYLNLGSPFRSRFANIECGGGGNGIRLYSESADLNPGDCTFDRVFVETEGPNRIALLIESQPGAGTMNQLTFTLFEAFASGAGSTGIKITGDEQPSRIWFTETNLEQFVTDVNLDNCTGIDFHGSYVVPSPSGTVVRFGSYTAACRFSCHTVDANGPNTVLFAADNMSAATNTVEDVLLSTTASESFVTAGAHAGNIVRRNIQHLGDGTATTVVAHPRVHGPLSGIVTLTDAPAVTLDAALGNHFRLTALGNRTVTTPTNPTDGQRILIEHIASGGDRTLTLATGASGAFKFGTIATLTATGSGTTDIIECVYSAASARWLIVAYNKGF